MISFERPSIEKKKKGSVQMTTNSLDDMEIDGGWRWAGSVITPH